MTIQLPSNLKIILRGAAWTAAAAGLGYIATHSDPWIAGIITTMVLPFLTGLAKTTPQSAMLPGTPQVRKEDVIFNAMVVDAPLPTSLPKDISFGDLGVMEQVAKAVGTLPPDKKGAVVAYADLDVTRVYVVARPDDHWKIVMQGSRTHRGALAASAAVEYSW